MFGMEHCIHFHCVMNGANNQSEMERAPQHLCPVCLRKLQLCTDFNLVRRYTDLLVFYRRQNWKKDAAWVERQLAKAREAAAAASP